MNTKSSQWLGRLFGAFMMVVLSVSGAHAAPTPAKATAPESPKARKDAKLEKLATELKLSPAQKEQVRTILASARDQRKALKASSDSRETVKPKMKALKEQTAAKLKGVLTPQQYAQFETMKKTRRDNKKSDKPMTS